MSISLLAQPLEQPAATTPSFDVEAIYTQYHDRIYHSLAYLVGHDQAEDLTQEVFVHVVRALPSMLVPSEIQTAIAFPKDYLLTGNRREQVKQLGNAITPPAMKLLMQRCLETRT